MSRLLCFLTLDFIVCQLFKNYRSLKKMVTAVCHFLMKSVSYCAWLYCTVCTCIFHPSSIVLHFSVLALSVFAHLYLFFSVLAFSILDFSTPRYLISYALPAFTPASRGPRRDARLSWPSFLVTYQDGMPGKEVTYPSTVQAGTWCRVTSLVWWMMLLLCQTVIQRAVPLILTVS